MGSKGKICLFMGYLEHIKGYRLYAEETRKIFRSRDVIFYEDSAEVDKTAYMMPVAYDLEEVDDSADSVGDCSNDQEEGREDVELKEDDDLDHESVSAPRRSSRTPKPRRWLDFITYKVSVEPKEPRS